MFSRKYVLHKRKWPGAWERAMAKNVERAVKPRRQLARISVPMLSSRVRGFNSQAFLPMASICFSVSPSGTRCCLFYSRPLKYTHLFSLSACLLLPHTLAAYKSDTQCLPTRVQISLAGSHAIRVAEKLIRFKGSAQFPRFLWDLSYPAAVSFCCCFFTTTYLWLIVYVVYRLRFSTGVLWEFVKYALLDYLYSWEHCSLFPLDCQRKITIAAPSERSVESNVCNIFVCNAAEFQ